MLIRIFALLLILAAPSAMAQGFDGRDLPPADVRRVQAALAYSGDYTAFLDGDWGRGTQSALEEWSRRETGRAPNRRAVARLIQDFEAERVSGGWRQIWHEDARISHLLPEALLERRNTPGEIRYSSADGGLVVRFQQDPFLPEDVHDAFRDAISGSPYEARRSDRLITSGRLRQGVSAYVRSDREGVRWFTHVIIADDANAGRMRLIAASIARERQPSLAPPPGRDVSERIEPREQPSGPPQGPRRVTIEEALELVLRNAVRNRRDERPAARDDEARTGVATAFRVNTTDLVTSAAAVERCDRRIESHRGTALSVQFVDRDLGIAVVSQAGRGENWIPVAAQTSLRRGAEVRLAQRRAEQGVRLSRTALTEPASGTRTAFRRGDERRIAGTPLLDASGRVVAMALGGRSGDAVPASAFADRLIEARVPFYEGVVEIPGSEEGDTRLGWSLITIRCAGD
ncbi:hypothetical protein [Jannaschia aquimarina]|uniref:Peptidoglycan binding domain protein n=1 Tax=Jannaschia aquimarina TaxID=935700 RepID=A0A0D1EL05_9RHOB|nr:hypothetical protein [Jannaschia aquimarina]KIT17666.1 hypothetical protein jaqu_05570 [Jannaschia aquimarina]SNS79559.1 hypothetical protein SAMN05421775_102324 [Jannaschia aquimarina]